jgi:2-iminobutanoate/2-iminopropanoate deaminase
MKQAIVAPGGPAAIGPYSPALRAGDLLFISGQVPMDPATGNLIEGDIGAQTKRALENIGTLLSVAGLSYNDVVRTTVFMADLGEFAAMNATYGQFFSEPYPARSTVQAARLPRDARIEIDVIACYQHQTA